jgi:hypothetical protein
MSSVLGKCETTAYKIKDALETAELATGNPIDPDNIHKIMGKYGKPARTPMDYVNSFGINSMLSGLASTGFANAASVLVKMAHAYVDTMAESAIQKVFGKDRYTVAQINAAYKAAAMQLPTMIAMGRKGFEKGYPLDIDISMSQMSKATGKTRKQLTEALREGLVEDMVSKLTKQGRSDQEARIAAEEVYKNERDVLDAVQHLFNERYDYMQNVWRDFEDSEVPLAKYLRHINIPTQATVAIDEFGKTFFRMFDAAKQLAKKATDDTKGKPEEFTDTFNGYLEGFVKNKAGVRFDQMGGKFDDQEYLANFRQHLESVTGKMGSYEQSKEYALRELFQSQLTGTPRRLHEYVGATPGIRLFVPFIKTPWNIGKQAIAYTPAGIIIKKSPLGKAGTKLNSKGDEIIDDQRMGAYYDFSEDELIARAAIGTAMMGTLAMLVDTDSITGAPRDAREAQYMKDRGLPPRSIQIGDQWIDYGRIEPWATVFGLVADAKRIHQEYEEGKLDWNKSQELMEGISTSIKQNIMQKTFFENFTTLLAGVTDIQGSPIESAVSGVARVAIPTAVSQVARAVDDKERMAGQGGDVFSRIGDRIMQRIPLLREQLPEEIGLLGPAPAPTMTESFLSMKFVDDSERTPAQKLLQEVDVKKVRAGADWRGLDLPPEWISDYRRDIATATNKLVTEFANNPRFMSLPKEVRRVRLEKMIDRVRTGPRNKLRARVLKDPTYRQRYMTNEKVKKGIPLD